MDGEQHRLDPVFDRLEAVGSLPEDDQEVVNLKFFQGLTEAEAGKILGVHEDTVNKRGADARIRLAGRLDAFAPGA